MLNKIHVKAIFNMLNMVCIDISMNTLFGRFYFAGGSSTSSQVVVTQRLPHQSAHLWREGLQAKKAKLLTPTQQWCHCRRSLWPKRKWATKMCLCLCPTHHSWIIIIYKSSHDKTSLYAVGDCIYLMTTLSLFQFRQFFHLQHIKFAHIA